MNEAVLKSARLLQSPQTSYLHLYYQNKEDCCQQTIPLIENFLFSLILFKTKTQESMTEAKDLLDKLLSFQLPNGNFPIYLHEWPSCFDNYQALYLVLPFYRIHQEFLQVLGETLKASFLTSFDRLVNYCSKLGPFLPYPYAFLLNHVLKASGKEGSFIDDMTKSFGSNQIGYKMLISSLDNDEELTYWHPILKTYIGPAFCEQQEKFEAKKTIFDVVMDGLDKEKLNDLWLYESLKRKHLEAPFKPFEKEGVSFGHKWFLKSQETFALSLIEQKGSSDKGFHPLRIVFKGKERTHSFVMQGFKGVIDYRIIGNKIDLQCNLPPIDQLQEKEDSEEISFFTDLHDTLDVQVEGQKATTFFFNEELLISSDDFKIKLKLSIIDGDGDFIGHIMRGNRMSQTKCKGDYRFSAFDLKVFLRTLRRNDFVKINVQVEI